MMNRSRYGAVRRHGVAAVLLASYIGGVVWLFWAAFIGN
jgi:hypothetical protein